MNKNQFIFIMLSFLIVPCFVYGQHYIIENIPNAGDDGLRPDMVEVVSAGTEEVTETKIDVITETEQVDTTVTETITENRTKIMLASAIGTASGAVLAVASTTIPLFATTPTMMQDVIFLNMMGFLVKRKNKNKWGVTFDIETKIPIPAVKITLFDSDLKELETTYSDKEGRFGFLAQEGVYKIGIEKKNYKTFADSVNDDLYGKLYTGGEIVVDKNDVLSVNIALKSTNINWREYADKKSKQYSGTWSLVKKYLFTSLYFIGFVVTGLITYLYPSVLNIILFGINIVFFVIIFFIKGKSFGIVKSQDKKPVPFAVVNLYNDSGAKESFAVTDVIGRYYMLVANGNYKMKVVGQPVGGDKKEIDRNISVKNEVMNKDIILK